MNLPKINSHLSDIIGTVSKPHYEFKAEFIIYFGEIQWFRKFMWLPENFPICLISVLYRFTSAVPRTSHFWSFSVHIVPALRLVKAHELLNSLNLSHIKKQNKVIKDRSIGELKSVEIGMDPSQNTDILVAIDLSHRNHTLWLILHELDCHEYKNIQIKLILFKNWSEIWIGILSCRHPIIQNCSPC